MKVSLFVNKYGTDPQMLVNNIPGKYCYVKTGKVAVMVCRSVMYIASEIFDADTTLSVELPTHPAFYLQMVSADGQKNVLIAEDASLSVKVTANYQIQAVCPL